MNLHHYNGAGRAVYVAGFLLRGGDVLLVEKNHPRWQAGFLNGIGGKLDSGEDPEKAMRREFFEEAGADFSEWQLFANEEGPDYEVYFYRMRIPTDYKWDAPLQNDVGEHLRWVPINTKEPIIGNLNWLLPLALDPREIVVLAKTMSNIKEIVTW